MFSFLFSNSYSFSYGSRGEKIEWTVSILRFWPASFFVHSLRSLPNSSLCLLLYGPFFAHAPDMPRWETLPGKKREWNAPSKVRREICRFDGSSKDLIRPKCRRPHSIAISCPKFKMSCCHKELNFVSRITGFWSILGTALQLQTPNAVQES